jgi:PAS domain S-box-containing protein
MRENVREVAADLPRARRRSDRSARTPAGARNAHGELDAVWWEANPETFQFIAVSEGAERLLGFPVADWLNVPDFWASRIHPDDRAAAVTHCLLATREGRDHEFQYRMVAADGSVRWLRDFVRVDIDDRGRAIRLFGVLVDVTHHRPEVRPEVPRALEASSAVPARILILDDNPDDSALAEREIRKSVARCVTLIVRTGADFDRALWEFAPDVIVSDHKIPGFDGRDALRLARARSPGTPFILLTGSLDEMTAVDYMKAGASDYLLKDRIARLGLTVLGALDYRQQQTERARAEEQYRDIFMRAPVGIARTTPDGQLLTANPELARMLGYDATVDLTSLSIARDVYLHESDRSRVVAAAEASGGTSSTEVQWKTRDGRAIWVALTVQVVRSRTGQVQYLEVFARDVSEHKLLESQLRQAQRMEAIGQMAGGLAHDFNNILTVILASTEMVQAGLAPADSLRDDVEEVRKAAVAGAGLTRQLLMFSRPQSAQVQTVGLNAVVQDVEQMLRRLIGTRVDVRVTLASDLGSVLADPRQIEQVLMNLAANARDAIPATRSGQVRIETSNRMLDAAYAARHVDVDPGPYVMQVRDRRDAAGVARGLWSSEEFVDAEVDVGRNFFVQPRREFGGVLFRALECCVRGRTGNDEHERNEWHEDVHAHRQRALHLVRRVRCRPAAGDPHPFGGPIEAFAHVRLDLRPEEAEAARQRQRSKHRQRRDRPRDARREKQRRRDRPVRVLRRELA